MITTPSSETNHLFAVDTLTKKALIARINRRLAHAEVRVDGERVKKCRDTSRWWNDLGDYYSVNDHNHIVGSHIDLDDFGRSLGVLREHERLEE